MTTQQEEEWVDGITKRIRAIRAGAPQADTILMSSTSEICALAIVYGRYDLLPNQFEWPGQAWLRLDDRQRKIVRLNAPENADFAARDAAAEERAMADEERWAREAAAKTRVIRDASRKPGRPPLGERKLTPAERKRRSRAAAGDATTEAIDRAIVAVVQGAAARHARWVPTLSQAVSTRFPGAEDRVAARIQHMQTEHNKDTSYAQGATNNHNLPGLITDGQGEVKDSDVEVKDLPIQVKDYALQNITHNHLC